MKKCIHAITIILPLIVLVSCEDLVEVEQPKTELTRSAVFDNDATATSAVLTLYNQVSFGIGSGSFGSCSFLSSLSSDESFLSTLGGAENLQFSENELISVNSQLETFWRSTFTGIYSANAAIEGLQNSKISSGLRTQLISEAKFFRAFYHFYLVNLFGNVPYVKSTDYRINGLVSREDIVDVYEKIIADLNEAKGGLSESYEDEEGRIRVNKWAASALLARTYLYREDWIHAEEQASLVISQTLGYKMEKELSDVFLINSKEAIWQLVPPGTQKFVGDGSLYNRGYRSDVPMLTDGFLSIFKTGDKRKVEWISSGTFQGQPWSHPHKYKSWISDTIRTEYQVVFRLAEQHLIRAEARAHLDEILGLNSAETDLNIVRERAGLQPTTASTQTEMLEAIAIERRIELFSEWGHRWFDLKRTEKASSVLSLLKSQWDDTDVLYPIPYKELQLNPNMTQNEGY